MLTYRIYKALTESSRDARLYYFTWFDSRVQDKIYTSISSPTVFSRISYSRVSGAIQGIMLQLCTREDTVLLGKNN